MDDKFRIKVEADTADFDRKIAQIESKIKRMREFGPTSSYAKLSQQYKEGGDTQKSQRMEEYRQRAESNNKRQVLQDLKSQESQLQKNEMMQGRIEKLLQSSTISVQNQTKAYDLLNKKIQEHTTLVASISSGKAALADRGPGMGPFSGRDMDFMKRGMQGGRGIMGGLGAAGRIVMGSPSMMLSGLGMVGAAVGYGGQLASQITTQPERTTKHEATTAGMLGEAARLQSQRKSYEYELFGTERKAAMEKAGTRVDAEKMTDKTGLFKNIAMGAAAGSFIPGAGTAVGAVIGGVGAFAGSMLNDRKRNMLFDKESYGKEMDAMFSDTYQDQLTAEKTKSIDKTLANEFFNKNSKNFQQTQRQFGLSDEELFKGKDSIYQRAGKIGYGKDEVGQAMGRINAAGGSTAVSVGGGQIAAQMARNMDLTNAPELMGKLSTSTGMDVGESKDAIIRMYAEATRMGLDASETRGFLQATADMVAQSGGSNETISALLGAGIGDLKTPGGVQAAASALEDLKNKTSQMGGLTGQYQMAGLGSEKITGMLGGKKGLNFEERAVLAGTDVTRITGDSDYIKSLFESRGEEWTKDKGDALAQTIREEKTESTFKSKKQKTATMAVNKAKKAIENAGPVSAEDMEVLQKNLRGAKKGYDEAFGVADGGNYLGLPEQRKDAQMGLGGEIFDPSGKVTQKEKTAAEWLYGTESTRGTDKPDRAGGIDDLGNLKRLNDQSEILYKSFDNVSEKTIEFVQAMAGLSTLLLTVNKKDLVKDDIMDFLKKFTPTSTNKSTEIKNFSAEVKSK